MKLSFLASLIMEKFDDVDYTALDKENPNAHSSTQFKHFSSDELTDLHLLVHDKGHLMGRETTGRHPSLDKAFSLIGEKSTMKLYRGIYRTENKFLRDTDWSKNPEWVLPRYTSLSEDFSTAMGFSSRDIKTIIEILPGVRGLNYHGFLRAHGEDTIRNMEESGDHPEEYIEDEKEELEFMCEEKEWILDIGTKLEYVKTYNHEGFTIFQFKPA